MDFDKAFTQQFLDFAVSLDPNAKFEPTIMPTWNSWGENHTEMLFNETILGAPDVRPVQTSASLLERCRYVCLFRSSSSGSVEFRSNTFLASGKVCLNLLRNNVGTMQSSTSLELIQNLHIIEYMSCANVFIHLISIVYQSRIFRPSSSPMMIVAFSAIANAVEYVFAPTLDGQMDIFENCQTR